MKRRNSGNTGILPRGSGRGEVMRGDSGKILGVCHGGRVDWHKGRVIIRVLPHSTDTSVLYYWLAAGLLVAR